MLIPAMAFAWCVMSAQAEMASARAPTAIKPRASEVETAKDAPQPQLASAQARSGETRVPIRTAIPVPVIEIAKTLVNLPMGTEQIEEVDGQRYLFVLERHYHPPGFVGAPNGWHKGVTAYELRSADADADADERASN